MPSSTTYEGNFGGVGAAGVPVWRVARAVALTPPLLLLLLYCWYRLRHRRVLVAARKLPSSAPTLDVIAGCRKSRLGFVDLVMFMVNTGKATVARGVRTVCMWIGPYPVIIVQSADDAKIILGGSKTDKSGEYSYIKFALGNGLLTSPGSIHRVSRRYMDPVLQPRNLSQLTGVFNTTSRRLTDRLAALAASDAASQHDIMPSVSPVVFYNICRILFGPSVKIDMESEEFLGVIKAMKIINKLELNRFFKLWLWPDPIFHFLWRKEIKDVMKYWRSFADGQLKSVFDGKTSSLGENNNEKAVEGDKNYIFTASERYQEMQAHHPQFTKKDFEQEMFTLIVAGAETTRTVICSCLLSLAADQDIQERLYDEIVSVAGTEDKDVTMEQLNEMPYLDQVYKETIRKFSVVPLFMRTALEDIHLSECVVPEGATVAISLISLQFDPRVFPEPERFDPNRFSPENVKSINKYNYIPFSAGSRNCIGKWYASLLVKTAVVHALRRFRLSTDQDVASLRFNWGLAMTSHDGYHLRMHPRPPAHMA